MMADHEKNRSSSVFMLVLFAFIVALSLILVVFGSSIYRHIEQTRTADNVTRAGTAYLASRIAAGDNANALSRRQGPQGDMLVLTETVNGQNYETRLYLYNGQMLEEYKPADAMIDPASATAVVDTDTFTFSYADGLLRMETSSGVQYAALRSPQEGGNL